LTNENFSPNFPPIIFGVAIDIKAELFDEKNTMNEHEWNPTSSPLSTVSVPQTPPQVETPLSLEGREGTGSAQSLGTIGNLVYQLDSPIARVNWNLEQTLLIITGKYMLLPNGNVHSTSLNLILAKGTLNYRIPRQLRTMFGRKLLESLDLSSNMGISQLNDLVPLTGTECGIVLYKGESWMYLPIYAYVVTLPCAESARSICSLWESKEQLMSSGVSLEVERVHSHGKKLGWKLTVRTQGLSSGVVIAVRQMLSLMNFEVESTSLTYSDGWIGTLVSLKLKAVQDHSAPLRFGLPAISIQGNGTQIWMNQLSMHFFEGW
jgi:hypothetical protein